MNGIFKIFSVVFISSFKFIAGPPLAFAYDFGYVETIAFTVVGGMGGVFLISYFSGMIVQAWESAGYFLKKIFRPGTQRRIFSEPTADANSRVSLHYEFIPDEKAKKKIFSTRSRRIVRIWRDYGLLGIALITPVIISIPVGTFIASRLVQDRKKVLIYMFISVLLWSVIITSFFEIFEFTGLAELQYGLIE